MGVRRTGRGPAPHGAVRSQGCPRLLSKSPQNPHQPTDGLFPASPGPAVPGAGPSARCQAGVPHQRAPAPGLLGIDSQPEGAGWPPGAPGAPQQARPCL